MTQKKQSYFERMNEIRESLKGNVKYQPVDNYYQQLKLKKYQAMYDAMIEKLANKRSKSQIEDVQEID